MIFCLIIAISTILFLVLNFVMNKLIFAKIKRQNKKEIQGLRIFSIILILVFLIIPTPLDRIIESSVSYDSFDDYLFWTYCYHEDDFPKPYASLKTEYGYLYSLHDDDMLSGFVRERDGKYRQSPVKLPVVKTLKISDDTIPLYIFTTSEKDLKIFLFLQYEEDFEADVDGTSAVVFVQDGFWTKVCIVENRDRYTITYNGEVIEI